MRMNRFWMGIAVTIVTLLPGFAQAASISLTNISQQEYENIVKELSSNFYYTTVSGASSLGKTFGFELGVIAGMSDIPDIQTLVKRSDPNTNLDDKFPHGNIMARLTTPFYGLTVEAAAIPKINASDAEFSQYGGAVLWTITDVFFEDLPVSLATRVYYKKTNFDYSQNISGVPAQISLDSAVKGIHGIVSKKFFDMVEPYAIIGYTKADGDLSITSSNPLASILASGLGTTSSSPSSLQLIGGVDLQFAFFSIGAEAARSFDRNSYTGRMSFRF